MQKGLRGDYFRSVRVHLISTPRNVSTALMYSFAQRTDTRVVDEPFYAYYLERSGADHSGRRRWWPEWCQWAPQAWPLTAPLPYGEGNSKLLAKITSFSTGVAGSVVEIDSLGSDSMPFAE